MTLALILSAVICVLAIVAAYLLGFRHGLVAGKLEGAHEQRLRDV